LETILTGLDESVLHHHNFMVNSLHGQGVNRLAPGLRVEARAPDGVIEAFSFDGLGFSLCLQWHPEWMASQNPVSQRIFLAFGAACVAYQRQRQALVGVTSAS
ncbi:MAG TPA: gamma-glutamyl-gamma-aminobutyrate hydrolase family protein, partial [Aquabacterium sp.]|nr:gamma-glutamyl-gamma-aminobutyrate hydrolase family protein [Aquabacterium sp.]